MIETFKKIWGVEEHELLASLDIAICYRQWWLSGEEQWKPFSEGLHLDQNAWNKKGKCCIQGMIPLYDVTIETGGL